MEEQNPHPDLVPSSPPPASSIPPLRRYFGNGAVADEVLWRPRPYAGVSALLGAFLIWIFFEQAGYSILSLLSNALLLSVFILFFWAKAANLLNRPLPPVPNLEISDETIDKAADATRVFINQLLAVAHDIAIKRDAKLFLQVVLSLWLLSYIGSLFSFLTLLFFGIILVLTIPAFYDKYQHLVHEKIDTVHGLLLPWYSKFDNMVISKFFMSPNELKKAQ